MRIGIHLGDIVIREGDIFGDGVNVAARVQPLAEPGGICITRAVYDIVRKNMEIRAVGLGPQQLKNVTEAVEVFHLLSGTVGIRDIHRKSRMKDRRKRVRNAAVGGVLLALVLLYVLWGNFASLDTGSNVFRFGSTANVPKIEEPVDVVIRFDPAVRPAVESEPWHPSQSLKVLENGGVELRMRVNPSIELTAWILRWGANAEVTDPKSLRDEIADIYMKGSQIYIERGTTPF